MEYEGFEDLQLVNQELLEAYPDNSTESPLERYVFLEELKLVLILDLHLLIGLQLIDFL